MGASFSGVATDLEAGRTLLAASRDALATAHEFTRELHAGCIDVELTALAARLEELAGRIRSVTEAVDAVVTRTQAVIGEAATLAGGGPGPSPSPSPTSGRVPHRGTITPSRRVDARARPKGSPARVGPRDDGPTERGRRRENEAADTLARLGYDVEQGPRVPGSKRPDYKIEGEIFDAYSPSTARARNIADALQRKLAEEQASRFVVNLVDSPVTTEQLRGQLTRWPIPGLKEVLAVKGAAVVRVFP